MPHLWQVSCSTSITGRRSHLDSKQLSYSERRSISRRNKGSLKGWISALKRDRDSGKSNSYGKPTRFQYYVVIIREKLLLCVHARRSPSCNHCLQVVPFSSHNSSSYFCFQYGSGVERGHAWPTKQLMMTTHSYVHSSPIAYWTLGKNGVNSKSQPSTTAPLLVWDLTRW